MQLLKEIAPATDRVVVIYNPDTAPYRIFLPVMETVAPQLAITLVHAQVTDKGAIETRSSGRRRAGARAHDHA